MKSVHASFLPGPVVLTRAVRVAFRGPPLSHREPAFVEMMSRTRAALSSLVRASHVALMVGTGTLANEAVAAQLRCIGGQGLILANGEFGERLVDQAQRWNLSFGVERRDWGQPFDWPQARKAALRRRPRWIWAVLSETSTGVMNPLEELLAISAFAGADLCLDAVSAVGLMPVDFRGVRFATAVSGKGLAAMPGLAAVFHHGDRAPPGQIPRYLDLANYETAGGVPFTHSSNLLAALDRSLALTCWANKFERVRRASVRLRALLRNHGLPPLAADMDAAPGIVTVALAADVSSTDVATELSKQGFHVAHQSEYLVQRNWLQICLMGEFDETVLARLPGILARQVTTAAGLTRSARDSRAATRRRAP
jgi:aspartate aminotransferase-like enzyme